MTRPRFHSDRGSALLMVLWASAALAAIAFSVATTVRSETGRVSGTADGLRAWYLASGSVERAIQWMLWGPDFAPKYWQPNNPRLNFSYPSGDVVVEMIPESAKLNINLATQEDLVRVVAAVSGNLSKAQEIAAAILDMRSGGLGSPSLGGSTFQRPRASFQEIEELLQVPGMTPELFYGNYIADTEGRLYPSGGLRDCLSVWGSAGPFDVNTMSPALMQALGVPPQGAAMLVARRQAVPFGNMDELQKTGIPTPRIFVGGGHVMWTIRATARLHRPDGGPSDVVRSASATVKILDPRNYPMMPIHVVRWYDDAWSQFSATPPGPAVAPSPFLGNAQ